MIEQRRGRDRRRFPRIQVRVPGHIIVLSGMRGRPPVACMLVDRSKGGALLRLEDTSVVPDDFYLVIDGRHDELITCSVARRGRKLLGVRFVPRVEGGARSIRTHGF